MLSLSLKPLSFGIAKCQLAQAKVKLVGEYVGRSGRSPNPEIVRAIKNWPPINNLKDLDHPNILKMYEFFEDEKRYYIVTDICKGGELFDEIVARGKFSEKDASLLMKQVLSCINYCHHNHIVHRDLKPENFLMSDKSDEAEVKMIDFGLSKRFL